MKKQKRDIYLALLALAIFGLSLWLGVSSNLAVAASADGIVAGVVTDDSGKPIRAASVTVKIGNMGISRFSDASGRYQIEGLKPGNYNISAMAYGYELKSVEKQIVAGATDVGFSLKQHWNPLTLSSADYISAFGDDKDIHKIEANCTACHNVSWIMRRRGQTAEEWQDFIPNMSPRHLFVTPNFTSEQIKDVSLSLEKIFGPDSPLPTKEQVHHVEVSGVALNSTVTMYMPPTHNIAHSLTVAPDGWMWFTEFDDFSNKIAGFDPQTEQFHEYEIPTPKAGPHNPWVARNGMVWISENAAKKLALLDPKTGEITEYVPSQGAGTHTLREDSRGNIWSSGNHITKFDVETKKFTLYDTPNVYDMAVDHEDNAWGGSGAKQSLVKVDSKTGDVKFYPVPNATFIRGVEVDAQDNIWFGDVLGHRLGKLDQKTSAMTFYQPPTQDYSIYGIVIDKKTGKIWTGDYLGARVTRFDPVTEKFTEFPFPSPLQMIRFFGEDAKGQIWFTDYATGRIGVLDTGESKISAQR